MWALLRTPKVAVSALGLALMSALFLALIAPGAAAKGGGPQPTPSPIASPTPSNLRVITTSLPNATVGADYAGHIEACCGVGSPYRWRLVSGGVPDGLRFVGDELRPTRTTAVVGRATVANQTRSFTVEARDSSGKTAQQLLSITTDPAAPLVITNQSDQLADGQVGVAYQIGVFPGGGVPPYSWSQVSGQLPPGLTLQASPGRVRGTPTTAGDYSFTLRVTDSAGSTAERTFSIHVDP
jgi:hypothetical protein